MGTTSGGLQIDSFGVSLKGVGNTPPALAPASFTGLPQSTSALTQPAIGLSLSKPYPLAVSGTLTLSFNSDSFADDPNIQFATGGRTVAFTIPANTTDALFNGSKQVQFQSGTVAGVIKVSAVVHRRVGGYHAGDASVADSAGGRPARRNCATCRWARARRTASNF